MPMTLVPIVIVGTVAAVVGFVFAVRERRARHAKASDAIFHVHRRKDDSAAG
jgi:hypothetical protein